MGWDQNYLPISSWTCDTGTFPSKWALLGGTQHPRDIDNHPVEGAALYVPGGAVLAPLVRYTDTNISRGTWFRVKVCLRVGLLGTSGIEQVVLLLRAGTSTYLAAYSRLTEPTGAPSYLVLQNTTTTIQSTQTISPNLYYTFGVEKLGSTCNFLWDPTGYGFGGAASSEGLIKYLSLPIPYNPGTDPNVVCSMSPAALSAVAFTAFYSMEIEELTPVSSPSTNENTDSPAPSIIIPTVSYGGVGEDTPGTLPSRKLTEGQDYYKYKTLRSSSDMLNHLRLDP